MFNRILKRHLSYLLILLLCFACNSDEYEVLPLENISIKADTIDLELNGYEINPITGDSIRHYWDNSIVYPIYIEPQFIPKEHLKAPFKISTRPEVLHVANYQWELGKNLPRIAISKDSLAFFDSEDEQSTNILIDNETDTVPTGQWIPSEKIVEKIKLTETKEASPMRKKTESLFDFSIFSADQGLISNNVADICILDNGDLWAVDGEKFIKYNGNSYAHYSRSEISKSFNLSGRYSDKLFKSKSDNIWLVSNDTLFTIRGNEIVAFVPNEPMNLSHIYLEDSKGRLWITRKNAVVVFDGDKFMCLSKNEGVAIPGKKNFWVIDVEEDSQGNIILITSGGKLIIMQQKDGDKFKAVTGYQPIDKWDINDVLVTQNKDIWLATSKNGVMIWRGDSLIQFPEDEGHKGNYVSLIEGQNGQVVINSSDGIRIIAGESETKITAKNGLPNTFFNSLDVDKEGNIWISVAGSDIIKYNPNSFEFLSEVSGLNDSRVYSILKDSKGIVWYGTGEGLVKLEDGKYSLYNSKSGLGDGLILEVVEDSKGNIWFASTTNGAIMYDGKDYYRYGIEQGFEQGVIDIREAADGTMWFGGRNFTKLQDDGIVRYNIDSIFDSTAIIKTEEDVDGSIWVASFAATFKIKNDSIWRITPKDGFLLGHAYTIFKDSKGNLWYGGNGLGCKVDGQYISYQIDRLKNDIMVNNIVEDNHHNMWISTNNGLYCLVRNKSGEIVRSVPFSNRQGLPATLFLKKSAYIDDNNIAYWGTRSGLVKLNLNKFKIPNESPEIAFDHVRINAEFYDFHFPDSKKVDGFEYTSVDESNNIPKDLKLDYDYNHLQIHFKVNNWLVENEVKYSYQLFGVDKTWSKPSIKKSVDYRGLSYGEYEFRVAAIGDAQTWSEPISYKFTILPPWWHTWWARIVYVVSFVLMLLGTIKWRTAKLKKRQKELEGEVVKATKEIREQRDEILDSINYAKRIQTAILPSDKIVKEYLKESFILYKPKDIVAGDFYWMEPTKDGVLFAAADCTGHGVPGAMVSVVCNNGLNRSIREHRLIDPGKILDKTREIVLQEFEKSEEEVKDGMDIALCSLRGNTLYYAGAHNPLWIIRKGAVEIEEIKADKQPIGQTDNPTHYTTHKVELNKGDTFYIFSDGYADQFGGEKGKKLKTANFKKLLLSIQYETIEKQKQLIDEAFENWKGTLEQLDDVCVIGVRV